MSIYTVKVQQKGKNGGWKKHNVSAVTTVRPDLGAVAVKRERSSHPSRKNLKAWEQLTRVRAGSCSGGSAADQCSHWEQHPRTDAVTNSQTATVSLLTVPGHTLRAPAAIGVCSRPQHTAAGPDSNLLTSGCFFEWGVLMGFGSSLLLLSWGHPDGGLGTRVCPQCEHAGRNRMCYAENVFTAPCQRLLGRVNTFGDVHEPRKTKPSSTRGDTDGAPFRCLYMITLAG